MQEALVAPPTFSGGDDHISLAAYLFLGRRGFLPKLRACLHGGGGPQVGEVTRLGEVKK